MTGDTMTEPKGYAQPRLDPRPPIPARTIGPVTTTIGGALAITNLVCWILTMNGIEVTANVQGSISIIISLIAGWAVKPARPGAHAA